MAASGRGTTPRPNIRRVIAAQCLPDLIAPEDIANLALFLASDDSRLITKKTISVNAGVL
jgi:NAD(P)-dependent dehydrogenase (short-subunit alcohol dehydrogenase family)